MMQGFKSYLFGALTIILLVSCQPQSTRYAEQSEALVDTEVELGDDSENRPPGSNWFDFFQVRPLRQLVLQALRQNSSLETAWNRLEEARSAAEAAQSGFLPQLEFEGGVRRSRQRALPLGLSDQLSQGPGPTGLNQDSTKKLTIYNASLAASYEVDLWGRIRSRAEAAELSVAAQRWNYRALAMTLAANITQKWLQAQTARLTAELLQHQLETMRQQLSLNDRRLGAGLIRGFEISRQEQRVNQLKAKRALTNLEHERAENQLAYLVGEAPQGFTVAVLPSLPAIGSPPPLGLSAELLQRRPDVQAAFKTLEAADQRIAAAVAAQLPRLQLRASLFSEAVSPGGLGELILWTLQAGIRDTLFSGGLEQAQIEAAEARSRQALYRYKDAVLQAYLDVANALANERQQGRRLRFIHKQLEAARQGLELSETSYLNGAVNYETFLEALMRIQELEIKELQARQFMLVYRLQLHRALGGKWPAEMEQRLSRDRDET